MAFSVLLNSSAEFLIRLLLLLRLIARGCVERRHDRAVVGVPDIDLPVERAAGQPLGAGVPGGGEDPILGSRELANLLLVLGVELADFVVGRFGEEELASRRQLVGLAAEARFRSLLSLGDAPPLQLVV